MRKSQSLNRQEGISATSLSVQVGLWIMEGKLPGRASSIKQAISSSLMSSNRFLYQHSHCAINISPGQHPAAISSQAPLPQAPLPQATHNSHHNSDIEPHDQQFRSGFASAQIHTYSTRNYTFSRCIKSTHEECIIVNSCTAM